jgi:hypothetical protein
VRDVQHPGIDEDIDVVGDRARGAEDVAAISVTVAAHSGSRSRIVISGSAIARGCVGVVASTWSRSSSSGPSCRSTSLDH